MEIKSYKDLVVWQKAMSLVTEVYIYTRQFPKEEIYGLTSQIKRAAVSIPSNIAEGHGRDSTKEYIHFLSIAYGSLMEVETQIQIAVNLNFMQSVEANKTFHDMAEIGRMLNGLSRSLKTNYKVR